MVNLLLLLALLPLTAFAQNSNVINHEVTNLEQYVVQNAQHDFEQIPQVKGLVRRDTWNQIQVLKVNFRLKVHQLVLDYASTL